MTTPRAWHWFDVDTWHATNTPHCDQLLHELRTLNNYAHITTDEATRHATDHARHCPPCNGWHPTQHLPRDIDQERT